MASTTRLRLALLGGFALQQGNREVAVPASGQRLIAFLALHDRPLARLCVAGTLWPDYPARRALADLRTTLWRVNHLGVDVVAGSHSSLGLCEDVEVDVRRVAAFASQVKRAASAVTHVDLDSVALSELSSDLLPDWYEDWVQDQREGLRQIRLHTLEALAAALSEEGRHADAIQAALAAIRLEPLRETAHCTLIKAYIAERNWSEAYRQFQSCTRLLREELGVEPSDDMRRLLEPGPSHASSRALARPAHPVVPNSYAKTPELRFAANAPL